MRKTHLCFLLLLISTSGFAAETESKYSFSINTNENHTLQANSSQNFDCTFYSSPSNKINFQALKGSSRIDKKLLSEGFQEVIDISNNNITVIKMASKGQLNLINVGPSKINAECKPRTVETPPDKPDDENSDDNSSDEPDHSDKQSDPSTSPSSS